MSYFLPYIYLVFLSIRNNTKFSKLTSICVWIFLVIFIGFRFEVGADWFNYEDAVERAGAIDQLDVWAKRAKVDIVKQQMGSDPASVVHDTLNSSISKCTNSRSSSQEKQCIEEKETVVNDIIKEFPDKTNASKNNKPSQSASQLDKGYIYKKSDTLSYKVIEYKRNNKTCKRWLKCKT